MRSDVLPLDLPTRAVPDGVPIPGWTQNDSKRFWAKVTPSPDGCWLWFPRSHEFGYGKFNVRGKYFFAHRLAWSLANGQIPSGLCVLHRCDVPNCVRPDHLFVGTKAENSADMVMKGRCKNTKLNPVLVVEIRALIESGVSRRSVARKYGIDRRLVTLIHRREIWVHV